MKLTYNMAKSNPFASVAPLVYYTYHETDSGKIMQRGSYIVLRKNIVKGEVPRNIRVTIEWDDIDQ